MSAVALDGELVLVAGGGQGLGAATSRVLASAGAAEAPGSRLLQPPGTAIAQIIVLPTRETSWP